MLQFTVQLYKFKFKTKELKTNRWPTGSQTMFFAGLILENVVKIRSKSLLSTDISYAHAFKILVINKYHMHMRSVFFFLDTLTDYDHFFLGCL